MAFERIVNTPKRGLGDKAQQKIGNVARENGVSLVDGARIALADKVLGSKGATELRVLIDGIDRLGRMAGDQAITHMEWPKSFWMKVAIPRCGRTTKHRSRRPP